MSTPENDCQSRVQRFVRLGCSSKSVKGRGMDPRWSASWSGVLAVLGFSAIAQCSAASEVSVAVPKATCGPSDRIESVQGQTTLAERFAPGPSKAYNCNLELVGQFDDQGASFGYADFKGCAYYSTAVNRMLRHGGVAVLDVSDPSRPHGVGHLDSAVMLDAFETLEVSEAGQLLLASNSALVAKPPFTLELYDLSVDCRQPVLKGKVSLPNMYSHTGQFTRDGRTYYGAKWPPDPKVPPHAGVFAVDVADASAPRYLGAWIPESENWMTHHVALNSSGTRAYVAIKRLQDDRERSAHVNGLAVLDVSDVQRRTPEPRFELISTLFWDDTHLAQFVLPIVIGGKPYVVFSDLQGSVGMSRPVAADVCRSGKPTYGYPRIIDLTDERHPRTVSKLMLEVQDPANCSKVIRDPTAIFGYGSSGCGVDDPQDARLLACNYFEAGLRLFDIRNPVHPQEVAYYKPAARRKENRPGSLLRPGSQMSPAGAVDYTADQLAVMPRFHRNGQEIWFTSLDNGFQVVRFSSRFEKSHPELFVRRGRRLSQRDTGSSD
ncbi:LVIVD repeat-containing protein [Steroidobacter flavus]|uniref:LVIVD repeat-containing protein n=1 Tax=Steroidobacter flavus TaxID=1842136 RepID=A0ABV8T173_9GAMM